MPVTTHIDQARERVDAERDAVAAKLDAFDAFIDRLEALSPEPVRSVSTSMSATAGTLAGHTASTEDRCRAVRTAFAETIRPHCVVDVDQSESLLETIDAEFTTSVAIALAPTSETPFSSELRQTVISAAGARRAETEVLLEALDHEAAQLDSARDTAETITMWIADVNEAPLLQLGFEALQDRHETLAAHREHCGGLAQTRQAFLHQSTNRGVDIGIRHRSLIPHLYQDFPMNHPLLVTIVRLDTMCADCQRAVRQHLVRRV